MALRAKTGSRKFQTNKPPKTIAPSAENDALDREDGDVTESEGAEDEEVLDETGEPADEYDDIDDAVDESGVDDSDIDDADESEPETKPNQETESEPEQPKPTPPSPPKSETKSKSSAPEISVTPVSAVAPTLPEKKVRIRPNQDIRTYIGDTWYNLKKGVETSVPESVKKILLKANLLDPL